MNQIHNMTSYICYGVRCIECNDKRIRMPIQELIVEWVGTFFRSSGMWGNLGIFGCSSILGGPGFGISRTLGSSSFGISDTLGSLGFGVSGILGNSGFENSGILSKSGFGISRIFGNSGFEILETFQVCYIFLPFCFGGCISTSHGIASFNLLSLCSHKIRVWLS